MDRESPTEAVARRVRAEMAAQRRTQAELAEALAVTVPMIGRRMAGEVPFAATQLADAARFLGVPLSQFLGEEAKSA